MPEELPEIDLFKIPLTYDWNEEPTPLPELPGKTPGIRGWKKEQKITDDRIRELSRTMNTHKMAHELGMPVWKVEKRIQELKMETVAVLSTESERFVESSLDAVANLSMNIERAKLLQEACDEWLRDADDPNKYNIGPRSHEIDVTYIVELEGPDGRLKYEKRKKPLSDLLTMIEDTNGRISQIEKAESKYSDPRELILKTAQEVRHTMSVAAEIAKMLADVRSMQAFRDAVILEIGKIDEETGKRIAQAVRRSIVLQGALGGLENMVAAQ